MDLDDMGLASRRAVLGHAYVDNALAKATRFSGGGGCVSQRG